MSQISHQPAACVEHNLRRSVWQVLQMTCTEHAQDHMQLCVVCQHLQQSLSASDTFLHICNHYLVNLYSWITQATPIWNSWSKLAGILFLVNFSVGDIMSNLIQLPVIGLKCEHNKCMWISVLFNPTAKELQIFEINMPKNTSQGFRSLRHLQSNVQCCKSIWPF